MKLGFDFKWFKHEPCGVSIIIGEGHCDYFDIVSIKILKFVASVHLKRG